MENVYFIVSDDALAEYGDMNGMSADELREYLAQSPGTAKDLNYGDVTLIVGHRVPFTLEIKPPVLESIEISEDKVEVQLVGA